jgi:hypothetical protein
MIHRETLHDLCFPASVQMEPLGWCGRCVEGLLSDETHQLMVCHNDEREYIYIKKSVENLLDISN